MHNQKHNRNPIMNLSPILTYSVYGDWYRTQKTCTSRAIAGHSTNWSQKASRKIHVEENTSVVCSPLNHRSRSKSLLRHTTRLSVYRRTLSQTAIYIEVNAHQWVQDQVNCILDTSGRIQVTLYVRYLMTSNSFPLISIQQEKPNRQVVYMAL